MGFARAAALPNNYPCSWFAPRWQGSAAQLRIDRAVLDAKRRGCPSFPAGAVAGRALHPLESGASNYS